jgi:hypothetical protein
MAALKNKASMLLPLHVAAKVRHQAITSSLAAEADSLWGCTQDTHNCW